MSADLFAEFVDFSQPPRQQQQNNPKPPTQPPASLTADPFSFLASPTTTTATNQQTQKWEAFSPQPNRGSGQWQGGSQQPPSLNGWTGPSVATASPVVSTQGKEEEEDDDDGWGDFEVAPNVTQSSKPTPPPPTSAVRPTATPAESTRGRNPAPRTRIVRAPTIDLIANNLLPQSPIITNKPDQRAWAQDPFQQLQQFPSTASAPKAPPKKAPKADSNVLFDADDFQQGVDDDDDFGEFETVASPAQPPLDFSSNSVSKPSVTTDTKASQLLLGLDLNEPKLPYPHAPRSPSFHDRNPFPGLAVATPHETQNRSKDETRKTPSTAWPSMDDINSAASNDFGDDWDAFGDLPDKSAKPSAKPSGSNWDWDSVEAVQPVKPAQPAKATKTASTTCYNPTNSTSITEHADLTWNWDPSDAKDEAQVDPKMDGSPPVNIPPPSVLLSVFPQLFDDANTFLFKPVSGQPFSIKNRIMSDPKTVEFLSGHVKLATVAARIIAGRRMRWHRDKFLSQSMSISAAGSKGMKLAGVDKAQTAREDREATDVVSNWKENIGRLRSAVAAANTSMKDSAKQLKIPEISESMPIQTAKMVPTAPKACVVCGLKRNERIPKVDYEVEDSFGEWWVEHWGHLDCKRFWLQHESALRQR
ncbi:hypothetical protein F4809DRAFT_571127 [Biscogniauxia mediterranea]|nr:hypothetical protein F4809DRAFT_571127 [Biscogniauxia mediterranea]